MRALLAALILSVVTYSSTAHAGVNSLVAFGVNTALSVRQNNGEDVGAPERSFMNSFGMQLKLLRGLGFELNYAPIGTSNLAQQQVRFDNPWTASGLIYVVPLTPVAGYLKAGCGNSSLSNIFSLSNQTASYHAGAGLEVHVTKHVVLGTEFLWLIPGAHSIVSGVSGGQRETRYYASPSNFRASLRASWYF